MGGVLIWVWVGILGALPEHPSLGSTSVDAQKEVVGPLDVAGRTFYAIGTDVIESSPAGVVLSRARFPATVRSLELDEDQRKLKVTVSIKSEYPLGVRDEITFWHAPGAAGPSELPWGMATDWLRGRKDAVEALRPFGGVELAALPPERRAEAAARLAALEAQDPTNPFYPAFRGELTGDVAAFAAAADAPAHWSELLRVSTNLENAGASDAAERAFRRGLEAARAANIRLDTLVGLAVFLHKSDRAFARVTAAKDVDGVHRIMLRYADAFPTVEFAPFLWDRTASWMQAQKRDDLAAEWRRRADVARGGLAYRLQDGLDRSDVAMPWSAGVLWGAILAAFLIGLARGARQVAEGVRRPSLARPSLVDTFALLLPLAVGLGLAVIAADAIGLIGRTAAAPGLVMQAWGAPDARRWVEDRLAPSSARDELVAHSRAQFDRVTLGDPAPHLQAPDDTVVAAFRAVSPLERIESATEALSIWAQIGGGVAEWMGDLKLAPVVLLAVLWFVVGGVLGARWPALAAWLTTLVPGGAVRLGVLRGLVTGTLVGALFYFASPHTLSEMAIPRTERYLGASFLPDPALVSDRPWWALAVAAACVAVHVVAVLWDRRPRA